MLGRLSDVLARRSEHLVIRRSREKPTEYDDHLLNDIGLTREQALGPAAQPDWPAREWLTSGH